MVHAENNEKKKKDNQEVKRKGRNIPKDNFLFQIFVTKERYKKKSQIKIHKGFPEHLKMSLRKVTLRTRR